jgi:ADP-ribosylglycohydrolase
VITIATLVGCAIGDALGNPFEMKAGSTPELIEWDGLFKAGGTFWKGEAGQYTDDTLMSIALAISILEKQGYDASHVAQSYLEWYQTGNTRGIGTTTTGAMVKLQMGAAWAQSGITMGYDGLPAAGNGTAMRASPIGLAYRHDISKLLEVAMLDASVTHNSTEPKMGSIAVALGTALLANVDGITTRNVLDKILWILPESDTSNRIVMATELLDDGTDPMEALARIGSQGNRGYVAETVASALYCLGATDNFRDCIVMSIKCGGDTDTTAAVAGALAGTWYGLEGIPEEYRGVENFELLQNLTNELVNIEI